MKIPFISVQQMAEVDRVAVESGLEIKQMMEYAGLNIARFTQRFVDDGGYVLILCGKGHNGGDGLAAARHLMNWGYKVRVVLAESADEFDETSRVHYDLLLKMDCDFGEFDSSANVIVDALLGYNIEGEPRGKYGELVDLAVESGLPILAVDIPTGKIEPKAILTLALPKNRLEGMNELYVCDLGIPKFVYDGLGINVDSELFAGDSIVKI